MDELDRAILQILQTDGRISNADLARRVNLSPPAVHARVRRLEEAGIINGYVALLDWGQLGYDMLCFIHISLKQHTPQTVADFRAAVQDLPEVLECHHVTGESDYLLKVAIRNRQDLERFVVDRLTPVPGIGRIHTSLALAEVKNLTALPI
ncbi:MAG: Lrp/AsnC family transcriptional regulator [Caldilineaceae bacterium]|nr:Lrp/AsnC family transcriptional regulator [Caldilineaceae bacterium]MBP8110199.1 Lrp/AsnC family transcriptional regulator [Caldilineaceae bacterium]MBP8123037.1 Lrp/AsnC family transcriptional regulator [Caldilineaceae bacterium]